MHAIFLSSGDILILEPPLTHGLSWHRPHLIWDPRDYLSEGGRFNLTMRRVNGARDCVSIVPIARAVGLDLELAEDRIFLHTSLTVGLGT